MRYLRKQNIDRRALQDYRLNVDIHDNVIMSSPKAVQVPAGTTTDRPIIGNRYGASTFGDLSGMIRYNTTTGELEGNQAGEWRSFRFKEPTQITVQTLGIGDFVETLFGPLDPTPPTTVQSGTTWSGANVIVVVENVIQIFNTNYTISINPAGKPVGYYILFDQPVPTGKAVTAIHGFDR